MKANIIEQIKVKVIEDETFFTLDINPLKPRPLQATLPQAKHELIAVIEKQDDEYYCIYIDELYSDLKPNDKICKSYTQAKDWVISQYKKDINHYEL